METYQLEVPQLVSRYGHLNSLLELTLCDQEAEHLPGNTR